MSYGTADDRPANVEPGHEPIEVGPVHADSVRETDTAPALEPATPQVAAWPPQR
jgi:hypothetical protein